MTKIFLITLLFSTNVFAKTYSVLIGGMSCESCAKKITEKFKSFKDVESVSINLDTDTMTLVTSGNQELTTKQIQSTLTDLGYTLKKID